MLTHIGHHQPKNCKQMKSRSFFYSILFAVAALAFFTDCSTKSNEGDAATDAGGDAGTSATEDTIKVDKPQFNVAEEFQQQVREVFASYLGLKDAFFSADAANIKAHALRTAGALQKVDMALLSGAAHHDWMNYLP